MIRNVQAADLPACLEVIRKSFATVAEEFGLTPENCPTHTSFVPLSRLEGEFQRGNEMYALFQGEVMVGVAQLASQGDGAFELKKLAVLPEYRPRLAAGPGPGRPQADGGDHRGERGPKGVVSAQRVPPDGHPAL